MTSLEDRNIALLVVDTLSAFHLPSYGYDKDTAPFLTELAEENTFFRYAYSNGPWTLSSHASLFSGMLPNEHQCHSGTLSFNANTFVEDLSKNGYETLGLSFNGLVSSVTGLDKGFEEFLAETEIVVDNETDGNYESWKKIHEKRYESQLKKNLDFLKSGITNREFKSLKTGLLRFLNKKTSKNFDYGKKGAGAENINEAIDRKLPDMDQPFFLFANYMEVHDYQSDFKEEYVQGVDFKEAERTAASLGELPDAAEKEKRHMRALYDSQIRYVDEKIREAVESIREEHPDTVFIIISDHGENIGHYGMWDHLYGIWERLIRIPVIVAGEGIPEQEIEENVSLREIHGLVKGNTDLEDMGGEKVFAEYYGARNYAIEFGDKKLSDYSREKRKYLRNTSKAVVSGREGFIENSAVDEFGFKARAESFSEECVDIDEDLKHALEKKFYSF